MHAFSCLPSLITNWVIISTKPQRRVLIPPSQTAGQSKSILAYRFIFPISLWQWTKRKYMPCFLSSSPNPILSVNIALYSPARHLEKRQSSQLAAYTAKLGSHEDMKSTFLISLLFSSTTEFFFFLRDEIFHSRAISQPRIHPSFPLFFFFLISLSIPFPFFLLEDLGIYIEIPYKPVTWTLCLSGSQSSV